MATPIHYAFHINLKPIRNQESQHINVEHQQVETTFPVKFSLYKIEVPIDSGQRIAFFTTGPDELISHQVIHIPVGDSLHKHFQNFKEILINMGIPLSMRFEILLQIADKVHGMDTCNGVFMTVRLLKIIYRDIRVDIEEDDIARAERESMEVEAKPIPATKSSIDALERLVFDGSGSVINDCTVCMEQIEKGSEVIRMPCSHVYHSGCLVQWLQTSHMCPLCRYHMPCEF